MATLIFDYLGYISIGLMVVLAGINLLVIVDRMFHRTGIVERAVKRAQYYIAVLRFGGGGARGGPHYEG